LDSETSFFMDDVVELNDVTGDGVPEILFHTGRSGSAGCS
jgi:hypothetical protein